MRIHLWEWEDQPFLPASLRDYVTSHLAWVNSLLSPYRVVVDSLRQALEAAGRSAIVDLCSGGGGPIRQIAQPLQSAIPGLSITLTDKFPNVDGITYFKSPSLRYESRPVDAADVPADLEGFRTLFTAFHHFRPAAARSILEDAVEQNAGIAIFEITNRSLFSFAQVVVVFLLSFLAPLVLRPFRLSRVFWGWILPFGPFIVLWDGWVSNLRSYSLKELQRLTSGLNFSWQQGQIPSTLGSRVTYLIGTPLDKE